MFTGIVECTGTVRTVAPLAGGRRLVIETPAACLTALEIGSSIAIDGVCTTVVALEPDAFHIEAIATTLSRTTLGEFATGRRVNLERPLRLGGELGGHLVQGHVDAVGTVRAVSRQGEHVLLDIAMPPEVAEATVLHGSITVDGVSLTVNALPAANVFQVALIPHTRSVTNMARLRPGDGVNLEGDMIGRFVVHYLKRTAVFGVST
ncbi:MAG: riboflavin synthase [Gemmatimonadetes bacterium]|nr:riboflavin synthase [Gemmatimonadota bacterium]